MDMVVCPRCGADAAYRYGKTPKGKQRYLCLICRRQFVGVGPRKSLDFRPLCPLCRASMHVYRNEAHAVRFRCSHYPSCRGFQKVTREE